MVAGARHIVLTDRAGALSRDRVQHMDSYKRYWRKTPIRSTSEAAWLKCCAEPTSSSAWRVRASKRQRTFGRWGTIRSCSRWLTRLPRSHGHYDDWYAAAAWLLEVPMLLAWAPTDVPDAGTLRAIKAQAPQLHAAAREPAARLRQIHELLTTGSKVEMLG